VSEDPEFEAVRTAAAGSAALVSSPDGAPAFYLVPFEIDGRACGIARVELSAKVSHVSTFGSGPRDRDAWPDVSFFVTLVVEFTIAVLYLTASWAMTGRSYGASLLGLRVLSHRGSIPGWPLAFIRAVFCVFFPVGLAWVILSPERRSVQDVVLRTVVVYDWRGADSPTAKD